MGMRQAKVLILLVLYVAVQSRKLKDEVKVLTNRLNSLVPPENCMDLLVSGKHPISDNMITASTYWRKNGQYSPAMSRINNNYRKVGAWCADKNDQHQWLQFDLGTVRKVTAILTKGREFDHNQYVREYQVHYGNSSQLQLKAYGDANGRIKTFKGNVDTRNIQENVLYPPIYARYVRINPTSWYGHISMRADLRGC
ncbi:EGF-like repeat and discoidin I-like domain-containing protein 3 [Lingula anatina]|uniref:EGF-like repeat and discoidin I-like domain-containing protein 3 n=1 Tax=Lingula anatina TaxID=7574 RepID=A0A1S3IR89_LINAN|nr:EGF-like repeat and discoidin I-like domain-containing protein 3 [Lingula anatina]|eukprot:XP_013400451.1 EGF-like repeat and discoidin I-like domain-containing protein 3 [Lingula anatina]